MQTRTNPRARSSRLALLAASIGFFIICLDVTVVNVALVRIKEALSIDPAALEWVLNAYTLAFACLLLTAGALADRFGARRVFITGFAVFTVASIGCALSHGAALLIVSRFLQGLGAALCVPSSLALLGAAYPEPRARASAVSIWAGTAALALGAGPLVGGVIVAHFGWQAIFLLNVPIGIAGIGLTLTHAPDTVRQASRRIDLMGQTLAAVALASLTYAVIKSGDLGWTSTTVIVGFGTALLASIVFLAVEARHAQPLLPLALFRNTALNVSSITGLSLNFGYYGLMYAMTLFFQDVRHDTPLEAGLGFLPMTVVVTAANVASGKLSGRFGLRASMLSGQALAALGYLSLAFLRAESGALAVALPLLLVGVGVALAVPSINAAVLTHVPAPNVGIASGVMNTARQIGGVLGVGVFGAFVRPGAPDIVAGLHHAVIAACLVTFISVATLVVCALRDSRSGKATLA